MKDVKKILLNQSQFLAVVAKWAVWQSPYHRPENLEVVLDKLSKVAFPSYHENLGYMEFEDRRELSKFVGNSLREIPEYIEWNSRKNGNEAPFRFTSMYSVPSDPDNDFIDLDALERNVVNEIISDQID